MTQPHPDDLTVSAPAAVEARRIAQERAVGQAQRRAGRRRARRAGGRDMVISLGVLVVPIVLIVWFFQRVPDRPQVQAIDPTASASAAQREASFPLLLATGLPSGWVPVKATWTPRGGDLLGHGTAEGDTWVVGYQAPDGVYLSVAQQAGNLPSFVADMTDNADPDGSSRVGGQTWQRYVDSSGSNRYLVRVTSRDTTIVGGAEPYGALEAFLTSLTTAH
ncbi:MAG TPA: DUF4245 domain-containing protein [Propionibacteriaceae bacterium]|nr:DUF4245 domain-containing protein [Propionibacteriaceae bacterium]